MTFIVVDICHRMGLLRMVYYVTVTFIFKVKHFILLIIKYMHSRMSQQIFLDSHSPRRELALATLPVSFMELAMTTFLWNHAAFAFHYYVTITHTEKDLNGIFFNKQINNILAFSNVYYRIVCLETI